MSEEHEEDGNPSNEAIKEDDHDHIVLPQYFRCTCHTLNQIATTDVNNIPNIIVFKNLKRKKGGKQIAGNLEPANEELIIVFGFRERKLK